MAKKGKAVEINRDEYNRIRKMDHGSMERHIAGYYDRGYAAGYEARRQQETSFHLALALEEIRNIKGVGETKLSQIRTVLIAAGAEDRAAAGAPLSPLLQKADKPAGKERDGKEAK